MHPVTAYVVSFCVIVITLCAIEGPKWRTGHEVRMSVAEQCLAFVGSVTVLMTLAKILMMFPRV